MSCTTTSSSSTAAPIPSTSSLSPATNSNSNAFAPGPSSSSSPSSPQYMPLPTSSAYSHTHEMALYLTNTFAPAVVPQPDEYLAKESARVYLEKLADRVSPGAKLLPFGSMANGFALKNSDMDLCCFLAKDAPMRPASELVQVLGSLIEQETNFHVKMLPRARIPIIKLTMPPTATVPFGMACDIGFENRLALENTRLLLTYAMVDTRLRTLVLFLKVWTKRRKINNPYRGTLSSYGFVLLVIHFLAQVKQPPVLPNLQQLPPLRPVPLEEQEFQGHDISFFDDLEALPRVWQTSNGDNVGELLIDFFRYFSKDFGYNSTVISIRSETGFLTKESKGWLQDVDYDPEVIVRDQHKLCIEDPFQLDYNVARTVTRDGLYTIRGEFMRAYRLLSARPNDRIAAVIDDVCEEREDYLVHHPPTDHRASPRRRSAPSPRMFPNPALGLPHPPPLVPPPSGTSPGANQATMQDFRMWAAMNGVQQGQGQGQGQQVQGLGMGGMDARIFAREGGAGMPEGSALEDAWDPTAPAPFPTASGSTYNPSSASTSSTPASRRPAPSSRAQQLSTSPSSSSATSSRPSQHLPPNASSSSSVPSLERRISWDGAAPTSSAPNGNALTTTGYDLHRFFQNQPGDSSSSSSTQQPPHGVEPRSALTAPSSPDLGSSSYYTNHGLGGTSYAPGRSSYRYGSGSGGGGFPIGPRMTSALPSRNQHLGYHSHPHQHWSIAPAPIFPEEDREAIALANSITFGNFPAPSYGNGRSSRSGAGAAGGGGYLPHHYGVGGSGSTTGSTTMLPSPARSLPGDEASSRRNSKGELAVVEDDEDEDDRGTRGRRFMNGTIVLPSQDDVGFGVNRQRGRSVPHTRMGPDGRESILFGEIQVVLPRPHNENGEEIREEELEQPTPIEVPNEEELVRRVHSPATEGRQDAEGKQGEKEVQGETTAASMAETSPIKSRSIPLLTTQPPTPLKQTPSFTTFSPLPTTPLPQSPEILPFALSSPAPPLSPTTPAPTSPFSISPPPGDSARPSSPIVSMPLSPTAVPSDLPPPVRSPPLHPIASPTLSATAPPSGNPRSPRSPKSKRGSNANSQALGGGMAKLKLTDPEPSSTEKAEEKDKAPERSKSAKKNARRKSSAATAMAAAAAQATAAAQAQAQAEATA